MQNPLQVWYGNGSKLKPWWKSYKKEDILAFDTEQVSIKLGNDQHTQKAATVDIVNMNNEVVYFTKIYQKTGSFIVHEILEEINGFKENEFDNEAYLELKDVTTKLEALFKGKLIIRVGVTADCPTVRIDMGKYDAFDLDGHWWLQAIDPNGVTKPQSHGLRSLCRFYGLANPQEKLQSSLKDARATMDLFQIYRKVKLTDDPDNVHSRVKTSQTYNNIPVLPNPIKVKFEQFKRKRAKKKTKKENKIEFSFD